MFLTVFTLSLNAGMVVKLRQYLKFERIHTINDNQWYCTKFGCLEKPKNLYFNQQFLKKNSILYENSPPDTDVTENLATNFLGTVNLLKQF